MSRARIYDDAMTPLQRRQKSDTDRKARGELRLTNWISPEANAALRFMVERQEKAGDKADVGKILSAALSAFAESQGLTERKRDALVRAIVKEQQQ